MSVTVSVPRVLRTDCGGAAEFALPVANVRAALELIAKEFPELHRSICSETGALRQHVNLFVNDSFLSDCDGLETQLSAGDVLTIMPAVSGG